MDIFVRKTMMRGARQLFTLLLAAAMFVSAAVAASADEEPLYTEADAQYIAKTIWGEARGCSKMEQAAVAWCILNRVDNDNPYFPDTISGVVRQPSQFSGYSRHNPVEDELLELAEDVLERWEREKNGETDVGRVLPGQYLYFGGNGRTNRFRTQSGLNDIWDWSCENPYEVSECAQG